MNRKFVYGCLGALVLFGGTALVLLYINVIKPVGEMMGDVKQLEGLAEMNELVTAPGPYDAPADGSLTEDQIERFAAVQTSMRLALGQDYQDLSARADQLRDRRQDEDGSSDKPGLRDVLRAFKGLGPLMRRVKTAQVDALNDHGFSYAEYRWVRETTYTALGQRNSSVYLEEFVEEMMQIAVSGEEPGDVEREGRSAPSEGASSDTALSPEDRPVDVSPHLTVFDTEHNRSLAAAYADSLPSWRPFLVFGL